MEISTFARVNETEIKEKLKEKIKRLETLDFVFNNVLEVLKSFEGKKPSKRIQTAVWKKLPLYSVVVMKNQFFPEPYTLTICGNGLTWQDGFVIDISTSDYHLINLENIRYINQRNIYTEEERAKDKKALRNIKNYCRKFRNIQEKISKFEIELREVNNPYIFSK